MNIFLRLDEAMTEIWQKLVLQQIKCSVFKKNIQITYYQTEWEISIYILSDNGVNFMSNIIGKMCKLLGMKKLQTLHCHPEMNGLVERSHQTIMQMIEKLGEDKKQTGQVIWLI